MALLLVGSSPGRLTEFETHCHSCYEIIVNTEGEGTAVIGGREYSFGPGSIHVVPPEMPHHKYAPEGFRDLYLHTDSLRTSPGPERTLREPLCLYDDNSHTMTGLLELLLPRYLLGLEADPVTQTIYEAVLQMLEKELIAPPANPVVEKVIRTITASYSDPDFQVTDALTATGYSKDHLRRCFRQVTGMTPHAYLQDIRLRYAKRLLDQGGTLRLPVSEIALMSGYYDPDYFCRLFRAQTGMTPTEYQRRTETTR